MEQPVISVILGSYNQKATLKRVLQGYNTQTFSELFEVIVVDSSSTDGTKEMLDTFPAKFNLVGIIQKNEGKAAARNRGVDESKSDIIVITDSDMIPDSGFIEAHFRAHERASEPSCFEGLAWNMSQLHWPPKKQLLMPQVGKKE